MPETDGKREAKVIIDKMPSGHRHRVHKGACTSRRTRRSCATTTSRTSSTTSASRKVLYDKLPGGSDHSWKYLRIHDDKLYYNIGAPCNICDPGEYAKIYRMNLDGTRRRDGGRGRAQHRRLRLRSQDRRPLVHRQRPRLAQRGAAERRAEPPSRSPASSTSATRTATRATSPIRSSAGASRATTSSSRPRCSGPHAGSLGLKFYTGKMFPAKYQGAMFIARHGPWNRTKKYADVYGRLARRQGRRARSSRS